MDTAHRLLPASDRLLLGQLAGHYCSPLSLCEGLVITITWLFSIICITEMLCFGSLVNQGYCTHFWWRHWGFEVIFPSPLPVELLSEGKGRDGLRGGNICVDEKDGDEKWTSDQGDMATLYARGIIRQVGLAVMWCLHGWRGRRWLRIGRVPARLLPVNVPVLHYTKRLSGWPAALLAEGAQELSQDILPQLVTWVCCDQLYVHYGD